MHSTVIPIYPVRRAVETLRDLGRLDLRRPAVRLVLSELAQGRSGIEVMRQLATHRRLTQGGAA